MAVQQIEELRLQRRTWPARVEIGEEWVLHFLEHRAASSRDARRLASDVLPTPIGPSMAMY